MERWNLCDPRPDTGPGTGPATDRESRPAGDAAHRAGGGLSGPRWRARLSRRGPAAAVAAVICAGLLVAACGGAAAPASSSTASSSASGTSTAASSAASTLTIATLSTGVSLVPAYTTTGEDNEVMNQIYGSLLQIKPGTTNQVIPDLATSYTVSPDGKTWTFQLRKGVKWQDGYGSFTCSDVKFTWDFNKNPANKSFWRSDAQIVTSVSCPNPYEAVFHLSAPFQGFLYQVVNMQPSTGWILSKAAWTKLGKTGYEKTPVGTGPYMLKQLIPNQQLTLVANPTYWGAPPHVKTVVFKVIPDAQTAALAVKTGQVDIASLDGVTADEYKNLPNAHLVVKQAFFTDWLFFNELVPPWNNVLVRRAASYAIDYKGLVQTVLRGYGTPGYNGIILPGQLGYNASVNPPNTYDPAKAKQLLKQSGVKLPITGFFVEYNDTGDVNAGQFIAANLKAVGIDLQSRPLERGTQAQMIPKPTTPAVVLGDILAPDPDGDFSLNFISSANPPAGYNVARYGGIDTLYKEQHDTPSKTKRLQYLKEIQAKLHSDVPAIDLYVHDDIWLVSNRVHNYQPTVLFSGDPLNLVTLSGS